MKHDTGAPVATNKFVQALQTVLCKIFQFASMPLARRLVLGLFVVQAVVLVFVVRVGVPPDETNHVQFIEYYANHSLSPIFKDQQPTYNLGDKTREVDYLYHYAMSFVYRALPLSAHGKYIVIRLFTVFFSLLCMLVLANVFRKIGFSAGAITAGLLIVTNLPMVLMMSSAINNDVLVWLGTALGLLLLVRLWQKPSAIDLLWLLALSVLGGLVKRNLLVLGMVFVFCGVIVLVRHFRTIMSELKRCNWHICVAVVVLLLGFALFTERVGGNLLRYGSIAVTCDQVQGEEACSVFWANIRAQNLAKQSPEPIMSPVVFAVRWTNDSLFNIVDIQTQGWRHEVMPARWLMPMLTCVLIGGLVCGVFYEKKRFGTDRKSRHRTYILLIAFVYIGIQMIVNYGTYRNLRVYGVALNGRYIIPSILVLGGFAGFYWSNLLAKHPRLLAVLAIAIALSTILGSGLLMMLRNPQMYNG